MSLSPHEKARIAERISREEPAQKTSERLWDSWPKQNEKSIYEANLREEIAIETAIRNKENK